MVSLRESLNGVEFQLKQQHSQMVSLRDQVHALQLKRSNEVVAEKGWSLREDKQLQQVSESGREREREREREERERSSVLVTFSSGKKSNWSLML